LPRRTGQRIGAAASGRERAATSGRQGLQHAMSYRLQGKGETLLKALMDHDVPAGHLDHCQICGSSDLELVLDCGHQPLCDSLLTAADLDRPERTYPLRLFRCLRCANAQLDYVVAGEEVYHREYPYRSGITRELSEYQKAMSADLIGKLGIAEGSLVVDIGSNDGTLLGGFQRRGMRVLGVEPTNISQIAIADGVDTVQAFFTEALAREIVRDRGDAALVTATNVFAHMATLGEVTRGIRALVGNDGVFVLENHYLRDVVATAQYDTIYHEHVRTYCLKALVALFEQYEMEVFRAERVSRYGGNIRAFVAPRGRRPVDASVGILLREEEEAGLYDGAVYQRFRDRVAKSRDDLVYLANSARQSGLSLVGKSCPGRCSTLLNYCEIGTRLMPYISEQHTSLKLGLYLPGKHIPVVKDEVLLADQPDYAVILAWHYGKPIGKLLRQMGLKSKLVLPLPELTIWDGEVPD
jgi:hypothetical protein